MTAGQPGPAALLPPAPPLMHGYSDRINHAFAFAAKYYGAVAPAGAGMDYLAHPANVAIILARYGCEQVTVVAGILHHELEESAPDKRPVLERKITDKFGPVALAIAKDALEPKFDARGAERSWRFGDLATSSRYSPNDITRRSSMKSSRIFSPRPWSVSRIDGPSLMDGERTTT